MSDLDSLNIKISASSKSATDSIDKLIKGLSNLSRELNGLNTNGLNSLGAGVKTLSNGMKGLDGIKKSNFTSLANGIKQLGNIDTGKLSNIGASLKPVAESVRMFSTVNFDTKGMSNFINSITRLSNAPIQNLANADFSKIGNSIASLSSALANAETVSRQTNSLISGVSRLATAGQNVNVAASALPILGTNLRNLISSLAGAGNVSQETLGISQAIAQLSGSGSRAKLAADSIDYLGKELAKAIRTLSQAPTVSRNTIQMANSLANLARTGSSAGTASRSLQSSLQGLSGSFAGLRGNMTRALTGLKSFTRQLLSAAGITGGLYALFNGIRKAIDISSDLTEVQNVVDVTFGDMASKVQDFARTSIQEFGMSELTLKQIASRFQAIGTAMNIDTSSIQNANKFLNAQTGGYIGLSNSMADVSLNLTKLTADMASFYNVEQEAVAEDLTAIFTGQTRPLRTYGLDLTQANLQQWALKQGLDADIQSMTQAEKTLLRYQYVLANTTAAQGDFARTAQTWANQTRILVQNLQQLASIFGTAFINMLKPFVIALNQAMEAVTKFAQTVVNALGVIFGWKLEISGGGMAQDFEDAADYADDLASGVGDAAKNAKKLKQQLQGFDELNVLTSDKDTGKGIGGAGGLADLFGGNGADGKKFNIVEQEGLFESEIDNFYKLGRYINKVLTDVLNGIDWQSVYDGARSFGTGLADFLNGLISPELFGSVGKTIANGLNTAIYTALSFGKTFDFEQLGLSIASSINEFFANFDFRYLAETINTWADGIWTTIKTALFGSENGKGIEFSNITNGIRDFVNELNGLSKVLIGIFSAPIVATSISKIVGLIGSLQTAFEGIKIPTAISSMFAEGGLLSGISVGPLLAVVAAIVALTAAFVDAWKTSEDFRNSIIGGFEDVRNKLVEAFDRIKERLAPLGDSLKELGQNFYAFYQDSGLQAFVAQLGIIDSELKSFGIQATIEVIISVLESLITALKGAVDIFSGLFEILDGIANLDLQKIGDGFGTLFQGLFEATFFKSPDEFVESIIKPFEKINKFFVNLWSNIKNTFSPASSWFSASVVQPIVSFFSGLSERVSQIFQGLWLIVQAVWVIASNWFNSNVIQPIVNTFAPIVQIISSLFVALRNNVQSVWQSVSAWFQGVVINPVRNAWSTAIQAIGAVFTRLWTSIRASAVNAMNSVIASIEIAINWIIKGINTVLRSFNSVASTAAKITGGSWGGVTLVQNISLGRIQGYAAGGFPEPYSLFAMNEGGKPEWIGDVGGKTGVVGSGEISGIREAVVSTSQEEIELLRQQNTLLQAILEKEFGISQTDIGKAAQRYSREYFTRTGKPAFEF